MNKWVGPLEAEGLVRERIQTCNMVFDGTKLFIVHPLLPHSRFLYDITVVLQDLASQENCDGEPYDQMAMAASHICALREQLEAK